MPEADVTSYEGIPATTVRRTLLDMFQRMPRERWEALLNEVVRRELIDAREAVALKEELE